MTVRELMGEYGLEIDDIRWYIAQLKAYSLLELRDQPEELARVIWSGTLESDLYDMEERYVKDLEDQLARELIDETVVRDVLQEANVAKRKRVRQ